MKLYLKSFILFSLLSVFSFSSIAQNCVAPLMINESATINDPSIQYFTFRWNKNVIQTSSCANVTARIETFNDNTTNPNDGSSHPSICTPPLGVPDGERSYTIDFFNQSSFTILSTNPVGKCFWWRIVIEGNDCTNDSSCFTATQWQWIDMES